MSNKPRMGRGLDALIGDQEGGSTATSEQSSAPVAQIQTNPYQPRKAFDEEELDRLTESVRNHGVLQPLVVRRTGDTFQLVAGERRLRAAQAAGLTEVPVRVVEFDDQQVLEAALVENIQRADLNPIEKARSFAEYLDRYKMTEEALATRLGLGRTTVSNLIGLLKLAAEVQQLVRDGQVSLGHAKVLKGVTDPDRQTQLAREVVLKKLSVRELEATLRDAKPDAAEAPEPAAEKAAPVEKTSHVLGIEDELRQRLAVRVGIKLTAKEKGSIQLGFDSNDDFERLVAVLRA